MKKIYVIFIASDYKTARCIRFLTGGSYSHVAISLKPDLSRFYSFARSNYYEPLSAGFQIETPYRYMKKYKNGTRIEICELLIDDEKYSRIVKKLKEYNKKKNETLYNYFDIFAYPFKKHFNVKDTHTCVSFVQELLEEEEFLSISKYEKKLHKNAVFEGEISDICKYIETERHYYDRNPRGKKYKRYAVNMGRLCKRMAYCGVMFMTQIADKII